MSFSKVFCRSKKASQGEQGDVIDGAKSTPTGEVRASPHSSPRKQKQAGSLKGSFSDAFSSEKMAHPESLKKVVFTAEEYLAELEKKKEGLR